MKKNKFIILAALCLLIISLIGCGKDSNEEKDSEKADYVLSNDSTDATAMELKSMILADNISLDEIMQNLNFPIIYNKKAVRFEIVEGEAIDSSGKILTNLDKTSKTIIKVKYSGNDYYFEATVPAGEDKNKALVNTAAEKLLHNIDSIKGNISMPDTTGDKDEITVAWTSSNTAVITDKAVGNKKAGVVTRGDKDEKVTLTAVLTLNDYSITKTYDVTVIKKPSAIEFNAYAYTYFKGNVTGNGESQRIHMAISEDGLFWTALNNNNYILKSDKGTLGVRDPYLLRSYEKDHFYLIGTDLDAGGGDWGAYANKGSLSILVWESDDLVNWSECRLIEIANEGTGCMWAPEATYDEETGEYLVYWSSNSSSGKCIWYATTRDFHTFSKAQIYKKTSGKNTYIDTTITIYNGTVYRFTKRENDITIFLETSDKLLGEYTLVKDIIAGEKGVEGPSIYKLNGQEKWCLYMDGYADENAGVGYFPLIADSLDDLKTANFRKLNKDEYKLPIGAKHGSFIPITQAEYEALQKAY